VLLVLLSATVVHFPLLSAEVAASDYRLVSSVEVKGPFDAFLEHDHRLVTKILCCFGMLKVVVARHVEHKLPSQLQSSDQCELAVLLLITPLA